MKIRVIIHSRTCYPEAAYALSVLLEAVGMPYEILPLDQQETSQAECVTLCYGSAVNPGAADIVIPADEVNWCDLVEPAVTTIDGVSVLHPEAFTPASLVEHRDRTLHFGFDIVQAAFWLLCRCEESTTGLLDDFDRFPDEQSWLIRHNLARTPLLNVYVTLLRRVLTTAIEERGMPLVVKARWPDAHAYAVILSHDVDDAGRFDGRQGLRLIARAVRRRSLRGVLRGGYLILVTLRQALLRRRDPYWNFETVTDLEARYGFRSTFYFVPIPESVNRDPLYEVDTPHIARLLAQLQSGGWEVGVHANFNSYLNADRLRNQREKLEVLTGASVVGIRQHYLRLKVPDTFREQVRAGFIYDSTLGYRGDIGFRAGAAFPFRLFDVDRREAMTLIELPLTVMDGPLFWQLGLTPEDATGCVLDMLRRVREQGGLVVLLWHQRVWYDKKYPGWGTVYEAAVEHLHQEQAAWVATGGQVAEWWLAREQVRLEKWVRIDGGYRLSYRASLPIEGLVLVMTLPRSASVTVTGVEASVTWEDACMRVALWPLAADQTFEVCVRGEGEG